MYYFGGNPLVPDEKYMPERNAVNSERGDKFGKWTFSAIRNAGASRFTVTNVETGEILASAEPGRCERCVLLQPDSLLAADRLQPESELVSCRSEGSMPLSWP